MIKRIIFSPPRHNQLAGASLWRAGPIVDGALCSIEVGTPSPSVTLSPLGAVSDVLY